MSFASYEFILFLIITLTAYYLIPKRFQWMLLLAASYVFYFFAGWSCLIYITVSTAASYFASLQMHRINTERSAYLKANKTTLTAEQKNEYKARMNRRCRWWFIGALGVNLGILCVLKYTNFTIANINSVLSLFGTEKGLSFVSIALPLGISYYTFQSVGYLIDVWYKKYEPEKNFFRFALFVSFFPQLIQGPISRYNELSLSLYAEHSFDRKTFSFGLQRILWGFFKKLVVADRLAILVNELTGSPEEYKGIYVVALMFFYAIQLYADFTGGIDITIGIAQAMGIKVAENFIRPFFSKNIEEYWRRWHITMGSWFRDYVFYPLSVSKFMLKLSKNARNKLGMELGKRVPVYTSTLILWFVTGVWHGASWNFIVWGVLNGVVIIISQELTPLYERFHSRFAFSNTRAYEGFAVIRTFWLMCALRLLDCYRDVPMTFRAFGSIFTRFNAGALFDGSFLQLGLTAADFGVVAFGAALMLAVSLIGRRGSVRELIWKKPEGVRYAVCIGLFVLTLVLGAYGIGYDATQFIYNQF